MGTIKHRKVTNAAPDPGALVDGPAWDDGHDFSLSPADVGLGNVDNTSDADKPVSAATSAALAAKAATSDVNSALALKADTSAVNSALALKAPLASPALTGAPTAPTPATSDNSTKIATTAYVKANVVTAAGVSSIGGLTGAVGLANGLKTSGSNVALTNGAFVVDRNGTDQTGATSSQFNKINFTNKVVDAENWFNTATGRYTPQVAGTYLFILNAASAAGTANEGPQAALYKNGTRIKVGTYSTTGGVTNTTLGAMVPMNGTTDFVEPYTWVPAAITVITGSALATSFQGSRIGD